MKKAIPYTIAVCCCVIVCCCVYFCCLCQVTTVILVRHAEKAATPPGDPPLTPQGTARAQTLTHVVEETGIDVIFATEYQRTQATVEPTATMLGLAPVIIPALSTDELVNTIFSDYRGEEILVAGHSNTVPQIMEGCGVSSPPSIADNDYDNLFVVSVRHCFLRRAKMTHLQYGDPSP